MSICLSKTLNPLLSSVVSAALWVRFFASTAQVCTDFRIKTYAGLCGRTDPQVQVMARDYEEYWGTRMLDLVRDGRLRMSSHHQQLHENITPPQKYGQLTSFRRRPSGDAAFSDSHPQPRDASLAVIPMQIQMSSNETSRIGIDLSRPSTGDFMQGIAKHHSPSPSSTNPYPSARHPEDMRHVNSNWHQQPDVRASTSTGIYSGPSGQGMNLGSDGQGHTLAWEQHKAGREYDRYQIGYNEWVKKEVSKLCHVGH